MKSLGPKQSSSRLNLEPEPAILYGMEGDFQVPRAFQVPDFDVRSVLCDINELNFDIKELNFDVRNCICTSVCTFCP
jgi:hypothetical protein